MTVSNMYNCVNFGVNPVGINNMPSVNNAQLVDFKPHSKYIRQMTQDTFIKSDRQDTVMEKLDKLFPNGELNKICEQIINVYGIEHPPEIQYGIRDESVGMAYNRERNIITINPKFVDSLDKYHKLHVEFKDSEGNTISGYAPHPEEEHELGFIIDTEKFMKDNKFYAEKGIKTNIVKYNDDDKRKEIIFLLAHELQHAHQAQIINQTEGLGMYNVLKQSAMKSTNNLIARKLIELNYDAIYKNSPWSTYNDTIKYSKDSQMGEYASKLYEANMDYTNPDEDSKKYLNNFTEVDANKKAGEYLDKYHSGFDSMLSGENLDKFLEKVTA